MFRKKIHVFTAGSQTSAQGVQRNFSEKDLQQVVDSYDPSIHTAPLVLGHSSDNDSHPAFGWINGFEKKGADLYADVDFTDVARDLVKDGHYRKVSISFYSPDSAINPFKGKWSARHLALLGASPPAVKGLEKFSFSEAEGVYDFAVALAPSDLFDEDLGPTLMVEKSPLEMLREKLDEVRQDVSGAVAELQGNAQNQQINQVDEAAGSTAGNSDANPSQQYSEVKKTKGREGTEITQQTADLEDHFPEEEFMDKSSISRKHAKGANGQVMQVVENVYEETHKELPPFLKEKVGKEKEALSEEHEEGHTDSQMKKKHGGDGGPGYAEADENGRYETARSGDNGYVDRMKTGKSDAGGNVGRFKTAQNGEQDADRMDTAENGEQDADRMKTAKDSEMSPDGSERWAGQADNYERVNNTDQYDVDADSYGVNAPEVSKGTDPYGRKESGTKIPVESEEMPDDEVFAVKTVNVMSDGSMRVIRQKSSDARPKSARTHDLPYAEPQADEMTGDDGVTVARKSMKGAKTVEHAEHDQGDISGEASLESFREEAGDGKGSNSKQLTPGAMDDTYIEDQVTMSADGVTGGADHAEEKCKDPYTKTGFGSTYDEGEGDDDIDEGGMDYGMGSMGQASAQGFPQQMYDELMSLKSKYAELERRHAEEKMTARREKMAGAIGHLYTEGRLTDGIMPEQELISYCEGLEFGTLEFSEGETPATKLLGLLSKLPPMVSFGEVAGGKFQYAEEDLDPHSAALKMVEESQGKLDYVEALKKAMYSS